MSKANFFKSIVIFVIDLEETQ